jgi:hypothetical protein
MLSYTFLDSCCRYLQYYINVYTTRLNAFEAAGVKLYEPYAQLMLER